MRRFMVGIEIPLKRAASAAFREGSSIWALYMIKPPLLRRRFALVGLPSPVQLVN
jgi:hypothetical protein